MPSRFFESRTRQLACVWATSTQSWPPVLRLDLRHSLVRLASRRARDFYSEQLRFNVDVDRMVPGGIRVVQLTPPGSGCSIQLVEGGEPQRGLTLVVSDIVAVYVELIKLGAPLSDVVHFEDGKQVPGHSDEPWSTMVFRSVLIDRGTPVRPWYAAPGSADRGVAGSG